jgi:hypothetical protein
MRQLEQSLQQRGKNLEQPLFELDRVAIIAVYIDGQIKKQVT